MLELFGMMLMILGPVAAVIVALAVPLVIVLIAYDLMSSREPRRISIPEDSGALFVWTEATEKRISLERGFARAFVILGGVFWGLTAFAGLFTFRQTGVLAAFIAACIPLLASLVTLIVGWYWERVAAVMLTLASIGVVYWGVVAEFELGVWVIVLIALIGPMLTAATLFWLARRDYEALEMLRLAHPEPALTVVDATVR